MKGLVNEMEFKQGTILVHCDNQSNFHLTKHQVFHNKSKHIDVKLHFIRDMIAKGSIKMRKQLQRRILLICLLRFYQGASLTIVQIRYWLFALKGQRVESLLVLSVLNQVKVENCCIRVTQVYTQASRQLIQLEFLLQEICCQLLCSLMFVMCKQ